MKQWTIGKRIALAISVLCVLIGAVGAIVWVSLGTIRGHATALNVDVMPGVIVSSRISALNAQNYARVMAYGGDLTADERAALKKKMSEVSASQNEFVAAYEKTITQKADRDLYDRMLTARANYIAARTKYMAEIDAANKAEANRALKELVYPANDAYGTALETLFSYNANNGHTISDAITAQSRQTTTIVLVVALSAIALGAIFGTIVTRSTGAALKSVTVQLAAGSEQTTAAAGEVSATSQSLADGASEQAASLEETSASLEEIASMTKRNAESAAQAKGLASETRSAAERGASSMAEMKQAMDAIKDSSSNIAKIVKTIDEIAFQTNILALNAAVEAARAGEAGAGFAVVSEEVRSLAQRSAAAAKETATMIEESVNRSGRGVAISATVASSFDEILGKARKVDGLVGEIATASNEQHQGIGQVTQAVAQMDKVTQANAAGAEEAAAAAEELNSQARVQLEQVRILEQLAGFEAAGKTLAESVAQPRHASPRLQTPKLSPAKPESAPAKLAVPARGTRPAVNGDGSHEDFFKD
ncbi:MAG TPA: methyl-accepting chemotaxis protein [Candidatus Didemnitutus sp.]|nr:methyl-accepting chemotaxis protein [Candidatus Didemnitutus sp.]